MPGNAASTPSSRNERSSEPPPPSKRSNCFAAPRHRRQCPSNRMTSCPGGVVASSFMGFLLPFSLMTSGTSSRWVSRGSACSPGPAGSGKQGGRLEAQGFGPSEHAIHVLEGLSARALHETVDGDGDDG